MEDILNFCKRISFEILGKKFQLRVERDCKNKENGRVFLQVEYFAPCTKTHTEQRWKGRKWYLSEYMTKDEIVKTAYCAFEAAVKHEIMEGFKFDNVIVFNPHVNFERLLEISADEVTRN